MRLLPPPTRRMGVAMALAIALFIGGGIALATTPVAAASLGLSPSPNIICCGNKDASLTATAVDEGHYAYISASSSGWISGDDIYLWYYVVDPAGTQSQTYPLGSCRPSGGTCDASTTYYAGYCALKGTYHVYVWGENITSPQGSNTADPTFNITTSC